MTIVPLAPRAKILAWIRLDTAILALLALPLLLLALRGGWFYHEPNGGVDEWVYTGFFRSQWLYEGSQFPRTYYGSRLTWVWPGRILYKLLGADGGYLALHLAFYSIGLLGLYFTLKPAAGRRAALLATLTFGCYPYVAWAHGWDYPDGGGMGYFLAGMALLTAAARSERPVPGLLAAGVAGAASFYTHVVAAPALLGFLLYYPTAAAAYQGARPSRELPRGVLWMGAGGAVLTVMLGLVNHHRGGLFWFYLPTFTAGLQIIGAKNPWFDPHQDWARAPWVYGHVFGALVCLRVVFARLVRVSWLDRPNSVQLILSLNYLGALGCFVASHLYGRPDLQSVHHINYLVPSLFLAVGSNLGRLDGLAPRTYAAIVAGLIVVLGLPYVFRPLSTALAVVPLWLWCVTAGLALLPLALRTRGEIAVRQIVPWVSLSFVLLAAGSIPCPRNKTTVYGDLGDHGEHMRCVSKGWDYVRGLAGQRLVRMWYNEEERQRVEHSGSELAGLFMWGYVIINQEFPDLSKPLPRAVNPGEVVVVVSGEENVRQRTTEAFAARGLKARCLGGREFRDGSAWLPLLVFQIEEVKQ